MTTPAPPPGTTGWRGDLVALVLVLVASLLLGGATSWAQGLLPGPLAPLANSATGWTLIAALLVWWAGRGTVVSAVLGLVSFVALVTGYTVASGLRGLHYDPVRFTAIGIAVGPFVGVAASWLRRTGWPAALGAGLLAGIAVGESIYGLTAIADTTGRLYWILAGVLGVVLLVRVLATRVPEARARLAGIGLAAAVATAFNVAYRLAGSWSV